MLGCLLGLVFSGQCLQWSVFRQRSLADCAEGSS